VTSPTITGHPLIGPEQIHVDETDAGNVLLIITSPDQRLTEYRELPPDAARQLVSEVRRVLCGLAGRVARQDH
jgi:hypothetical protein